MLVIHDLQEPSSLFKVFLPFFPLKLVWLFMFHCIFSESLWTQTKLSFLLNLYYKIESLVKFISMLKQAYTKICTFLDIILACKCRWWHRTLEITTSLKLYTRRVLFLLIEIFCRNVNTCYRVQITFHTLWVRIVYKNKKFKTDFNTEVSLKGALQS